jgi:hypothetical protein
MHGGGMKMKKKQCVSVLVCSLFAIFIFGCSSIEVSQDYQLDWDFGNLKTYAWKYKDQEKTGDMRIDSQLLDDRIRKATEENLLEKGFTKIFGHPPDFQIVYKYSISRKIYSNPVSTGLGFGYGHYGSVGTIGIRTGAQINEYDEGLLIIDFLKPDSDIVLWRGNSTRVVETHSTPEKRIRDIDQTIGKMLAQFPPDK